MIGTVDFDADVLAILTSTGTLAGSDFLGAPTVNYLNPSKRGLEIGDSVAINGPKEILLDVVASSPGDFVRVLTAASPVSSVPEPGSIYLLASGLFALSAALRKKLFTFHQE